MLCLAKIRVCYLVFLVSCDIAALLTLRDIFNLELCHT